jgi:hypothetical protein
MRLFLAGLALLLSPPALAQDTGPARGTWGVEAGSFGSASLLRFRSPTAAWLAGFSFELVDEERTSTSPAGSNTTEEKGYSVNLRLGHRWYRTATERLRPYTTLGFLVGTSTYIGDDWMVGSGLDLGAAWFFSPHFSVGAEAGVSIVHMQGEDASGTFSWEVRRTIVSGSGFRMLAAVYF